MTIYVGNLSFQAEQEDLLDLFSQYGEVSKCSLPLDRETGRKRGFAFVEMANDADEQKAIDDLQNVEWMGRMIRVNKATPREGGGGGGGRGGYGGGGGGGGGNRGGGGGYGGGGGGRGGYGGGGGGGYGGGGGGGYGGGGDNRW
ncbi:RNA recognition motif domain-containing protein [Synechococcus sp. NB0720_010]|uniref:RNA recognition motif domain-containing protein n=4 Tax=Synechococcaceae TaxID=1890426 RepID=UPI003530531B